MLYSHSKINFEIKFQNSDILYEAIQKIVLLRIECRYFEKNPELTLPDLTVGTGHCFISDLGLFLVSGIWWHMGDCGDVRGPPPPVVVDPAVFWVFIQ